MIVVRESDISDQRRRRVAREDARMDDTAGRDYLARLGLDTRPEATDETLRELHRTHLETVPFENLSIHLAEPISLDEAPLLDKIVTRRRGGFCYELNGGFALLLEWLGYRVTRAGAAVFGGAGDDGPRLGPPFDHLALLVQARGGAVTWLADVGFGAHSTYPLRLDLDAPQADPGGMFLLAAAGEDIDVHQDGAPVYRLERRTRSLADFGPTCWWQQTSPDSHFTLSTICSRLTPDGRVSISGRTLIRTRDGVRYEAPLPDDDAVLAAYRDELGVVLDRVPEVRVPEVSGRASPAPSR
jgi:N-hydroxyarylamine O-acetyltransferase